MFAYYTDNFDYSPLYQPNFMYNEQVKYEGGEFKYGLTKYWPNEVHDFWGDDVDDQNNDSANDPATTDYTNGGLVSFFAYAPYVPETSKVTTPAIAGQTV